MTISSTLTGSGYEVALVNAVQPSFTWAGKPAATAVPTGTIIRITDYGVPFLLVASDGTRWVPAGPQMLARSGVAASVTGSTSETALATVAVPAGAMGVNGGLRVETSWGFTASTNVKTMRARLGGIGGTQFLGQSVSAGTSVVLADVRRIRNRNSASSQVGNTNAGASAFGTTTAAVTTASIDTTVAVDLVISGQLATASETLTLENYEVWLLP